MELFEICDATEYCKIGSRAITVHSKWVIQKKLGYLCSEQWGYNLVTPWDSRQIKDYSVKLVGSMSKEPKFGGRRKVGANMDTWILQWFVLNSTISRVLLTFKQTFAYGLILKKITRPWIPKKTNKREPIGRTNTTEIGLIVQMNGDHGHPSACLHNENRDWSQITTDWINQASQGEWHLSVQTPASCLSIGMGVCRQWDDVVSCKWITFLWVSDLWTLRSYRKPFYHQPRWYRQRMCAIFQYVPYL